MGQADFSRVVFLVGDAIHGVPDRPWTYLVGNLRTTGHFDDPAARECRLHHADASDPTPAEVVLFCRVQFVVNEAVASL